MVVTTSTNIDRQINQMYPSPVKSRTHVCVCACKLDA